MKAPESASQSSPVSPHVPTMRVDTPPAVPSWEREGAAPTATSFAGEASKPRKSRFSFHFRWGRIALIVASLLVTVTTVVVWRTTLERPANLAATAPNQTDNHTNTMATSNSAARTNQVGIEFVLIPAGSFMMGSSSGDANAKPVHQVTINYSFYMGKYEITQAQWQAVMRTTISLQRFNVLNRRANSGDDYGTRIVGEGNNYPMYLVGLEDALEFIRRLNDLNDGFMYRLPSEAEWEYACRAGTQTPFAFGSSLSPEKANFDTRETDSPANNKLFRGQTTQVGSFSPNAFGLFDMHGNVEEWVQDYWHDNYDRAPTDGSIWMSGGWPDKRILRGGSWQSFAAYCNCAYRDVVARTANTNSFGFRVVAIARTQ